MLLFSGVLASTHDKTMTCITATVCINTTTNNNNGNNNAKVYLLQHFLFKMRFQRLKECANYISE